MDAAKFIAERMSEISSSGIRRIFDLAATLTDPVDFSIGQPDFAVPENIKQAAIEAIRQDRNGYTVTHGISELREAIRADLARDYAWDVPVLVTSGVSGALTLLFMACLNPGDEVVYADPYFVVYPYVAHMAGARPVAVDTYPTFDLRAEAFAAAITPRTRMLVINSPANPTGVVTPRGQIEALCALARERDLLIVSDEIYTMLSFDGPCTSPVSFAPERTVLLRGFGKSYGMTGWRMGYAAGPAPIIAEMAKLQQYTYVCAPHPFQRACLEALRTDMSAQVEAYRRKRDRVAATLSRKFEFAKPAGGFYFFPEAPAAYPNATAFVEAAIKRSVLVVPGSVFSKRDTHFRISYAVADEKLNRGCEILCDLA